MSSIRTVMKDNETTKRPAVTGSAAPTKAILGSLQKTTHKTAAIPHKWEKHRKHLLALRSHLEATRRNHSLTAREPLETFSMDMADAATDEFDHALALSRLSSEQAALYEIDEALARIANGTFGICEVTGKPIPESRLNVVPWTRFSGEVERGLEKRGETNRARLGAVHSATGHLPGKLATEPGEEEPEQPLPADEELSTIPRLPKR